MNFEEIFTDVFQKNGLNEFIHPEIIRKFEALTEIMIETNKHMNITALTTIDKIIPLHYADCLMAAKYIPEKAKVLDVGCGGGFPTLPLAIVRPDLDIVGLDSTEKKVNYVADTAKQLGLSIETISARAEELAKDPMHREKYDVVISRAVARLPMLSELCLPFVKVNGSFVAMKGAAGDEEYQESKKAIEILGGVLNKNNEYTLQTAESTELRTVFEIRKNKPTPAQYPRVFGTIKKRPL